MGFRKGHLYFGYLHTMNKNKFFVVVRECRKHVYIAPINSRVPEFLMETLSECFVAIGPNDIWDPQPNAPYLRYSSWLSVAPKRARTLPSLLHSQEPNFTYCGKVRPAVLNALYNAIAMCKALKRKHRAILLGNGDC